MHTQYKMETKREKTHTHPRFAAVSRRLLTHARADDCTTVDGREKERRERKEGQRKRRSRTQEAHTMIGDGVSLSTLANEAEDDIDYSSTRTSMLPIVAAGLALYAVLAWVAWGPSRRLRCRRRCPSRARVWTQPRPRWVRRLSRMPRP